MRKLHLSPVVVIFVASLILVSIWFRHGLVMGTAESGLSFYNISTLEFKTRYTWTEMNLGAPTYTLPSVWPAFCLFLWLARLGIPEFLIQASTFYFILMSSGLSIFYLTRLLFPRMTDKAGLVAVFFYWFNPLIVVDIWNRFLLDLSFGYAFLPLALYILLAGIKTQKYVYVIIFGIVSVFFSFAFAALVEMLLIWGMLFFAVIYYFVISDWKNKFFIVKFFVLLFTFFCMINSWWLSQVVYLTYSPDFGSAVSKFAPTLGNLDNLNSISAVLGSLSNIFRFAHISYFSLSSFWTDIFQSFPARLLEYLATILIIFTIVLFRKKKNLLFLALLMFTGIFLMKGSSPPLGEVFSYFFVSFSPFQLFRNPFEKFSIMVVLPAAIIFAFSFENVILKLKNRLVRKVCLALVFIVLFFLWGYPVWTGTAFSDPGTSSWRRLSFETEIPEYYKDAASWVKEQSGHFRFLSLPMSPEGLIYDWEHPYRGIDLTFLILPVPSISNITTVPYFNTIASGIEQSFFEDAGFDKVLSALNVKYILLRQDIQWQFGGMRNPSVITKILTNKPDFAKIKEFSKVAFWENKLWKEKTIYASNKYVASLPAPSIFDIGLGEVDNGSILVTPGTGSEYLKVIRPSHILSYSPALDTNFEIDQDIFPHVNTLPNTRMYPLVLLKEKLNLLLISDHIRRTEVYLTLLGKRLVEAKMANDVNDQMAIGIALSNYTNQLEDFEKALTNLSSGQTAWRQERMVTVFAKHLSLINQLKSDSVVISEVTSTIGELLRRDHIIPQHDFATNSDSQLTKRNVFQLEVPRDEIYSVYLNTKGWDTYYESDIRYIQIDDELYSLPDIFNQEGVTKLGEFTLSEGLHELSYDIPQAQNLVESPQEFSFFADEETNDLRFSVNNFYPYSNYEISFDYILTEDSGFSISLSQDNDPETNGQKSPTFSKEFANNSYDATEKNFKIGVTPSIGATSAEVVISASSFTKGVGEVIIKNLRVERIFDVEPFLTSIPNAMPSATLPEISYERINPTSYTVNVANATGNFVLVFSELFNSGWKATYLDGREVSDSSHYLINGYANGWMIDNKGDYKIMLDYTPEKYLGLGKVISVSSLALGVVIIAADYILGTRRNG